MVKVKRALLSLFLFFAFISMTAFSSSPRLVDDAGLYSKEEADILEARLQEFTDKYGMDIVVHTTNDTKGMGTIPYMDKYWEDSGYGLKNGGIMLFCDMENREIRVHTEKRGIEKINDAKVEKLLDAFFDNGLSDGRYYDATKAYLDKLEDYLLGQRLKPSEALGGLVASILTGGAVFSTNKSRYSRKTNPVPFDLNNNSVSNYLVSDLKLTREYSENRRIVAAATSSSGGGTTTRSSSTGSGRSYGGGGRKF